MQQRAGQSCLVWAAGGKLGLTVEKNFSHKKDDYECHKVAYLIAVQVHKWKKREATWNCKRRHLERYREFASRAAFAVCIRRRVRFQRRWEECIPGRGMSMSKDLDVGETGKSGNNCKQFGLNGTWHLHREVTSGNSEHMGKTSVSTVSTKCECV